MPTPLSEDIFQECIEQAVQKVFQTMLQKTATPVPGASPVPATADWTWPADLSATVAIGSVGFAGDISGLVFLYLSEDLAHRIVSGMLGMTPAEVTEAGREVASDVIGELTNMTVGVFKNRIHDLGYPCKLTIPTVVWGDEISIRSPRGAVRRTYVFTVEGRSVVADLIFKED
ncbi:MAG TPA: chemotaxis protein CheX [Opitutaceae bacterium]|nr:chemotaxis protein CheX [Opitutaceae bacterium]